MKLDIAILGGGMAGGLLARQLTREVPGLRIGLFDKATESSYKVGESTVEIASSYLGRKLGLTRYLYERHLPKNGLRYFFDDAEHGAELTEMSEVGTVNLPFHPSFQVDRARLDADLAAMNEQAGVGVHLGTKVHGLEIASGGAEHHLEIERAGRRERVACRWLLDASGRAGLVARAKGLRQREPEHALHAVWGRFEGVSDIDDWGDPEFAARVRYTSRGISTMHFCYSGYWIWFIPLGGGVTSIGMVGRPAVDMAPLRTEAGFKAFLDSHRALRSLLHSAKSIDVASYKNFSYRTERYFSADRWAVVGEAAAFADPLYSPGADFIALENDFVCDLVRRDEAGATQEEQEQHTERYDAFMQFRHEAAMRLYRGLYGMLGCYDLMRLKWDFDIGCYYNLWFDPYLKDQYLEEPFLRRQIRQQRFVLQALQNFNDLFRRAEGHLRETGQYHRNNTGIFSHGLQNLDFLHEVGLPRTQRVVLGKTAEIFNTVRHKALDLMDRDTEGDLPLTAMMTPQPLVEPEGASPAAG